MPKKRTCVTHTGSTVKPQACKRQCLSRRRIIRNLISNLPCVCLKTVRANCCWSLVRFESFIQAPLLYSECLAKSQVIQSCIDLSFCGYLGAAGQAENTVRDWCDWQPVAYLHINISIDLESLSECIHFPFSSGWVSTNSWGKKSIKMLDVPLHQLVANLFLLFGAAESVNSMFKNSCGWKKCWWERCLPAWKPKQRAKRGKKAL